MQLESELGCYSDTDGESQELSLLKHNDRTSSDVIQEGDSAVPFIHVEAQIYFTNVCGPRCLIGEITQAYNKSCGYFNIPWTDIVCLAAYRARGKSGTEAVM